MTSEKQAFSDPQLRAAVLDRRRALAVGTLALPNLFARSVATLVLLYGLLGLVLITVVEAGYATPELALLTGVAIAIGQYVLGPWFMDLSLRWLYRMRWVRPEELPEHLKGFVQKVCEANRFRFPDFGVIDDGAPQAFTYGHHPGNARVVISRGLMEILDASELEAVVAHELGHARNWDMALMVMAQLVPLLLYYVYRVGMRMAARGSGKDKGRGVAIAVAVGAYLVYIISEYIVLWFSRTREYNADRFAGSVTGNPNALVTALVKIAYGLAAQDQREAAEAEKQEKKKEKHRELAGVGPLGALGIFERRSAVNLVMCSAGGETSGTTPDLGHVKSAMQWDLWNPWAGFYELNSTHPLVAKRITYLSDQAAAMGQEPLVLFDRAKPESYWDEFLVDLAILMLPGLGVLAALAVGGNYMLTGAYTPAMLGGALTLTGVGYLVATLFKYRMGIYPHLTVSALMGHVKVSPVRPVLATVSGTVIGKGVPGLIFSEDFVIRDSTGILFLDFHQPLGIWNFLFGLLKANKYQGKEVRVTGWFRRAPSPYLEIYRIETADGSVKARTCYARHARIFVSLLLIFGGIPLAAWIGTF